MARLVGGAGLDAVGVVIDVTQHPPVGDEAVGAVELPLLGFVGGGNGIGFAVADGHEQGILHGLFGDEIDVPGGGVVLGIVKAGGVDEVGVFAAQLLSPLVHPLHEGGGGAVDGFGEDVAHLVGGNHHHTVEQLLHRQGLALHDVRCAAVLRQIGQSGGGGGDGLVQPQVAAVHGLQHQQHDHDLGDAGGILLGVGVFVVEDHAGIAVHQQGRLGLDVRIGDGVGPGQAEQTAQQGGQQKIG